MNSMNNLMMMNDDSPASIEAEVFSKSSCEV